MLVTFLTREPRAFAVVLPSVVVAGTVQALGVFYLTASGVDWASGIRINGVLGSEPQLLMVAGCLGGLSLLWFECGRPMIRVGAAGSVLLMTAALAVMRFRAAWVAVIVGVLVFLWTANPRRRVAGVMVGILLAGGGWLAYSQGFLPAAVDARLDQTFDATASDLDLRVESTAELAEVFYDNPIVGIGPGQSNHYLPAYFVLSRVGAAHNVVANAAVEGGVLAGVGLVGVLIASIALAGSAVRRTRDPHVRKVAVWALSSACGLAAGVQFVPTIYWRSFFVVLAMCAAVAIVSRRSTAE
jgi:O-antigen ligase